MKNRKSVFLQLFISCSTLLSIILAVCPTMFGYRFENQMLLLSGLFASPLIVWFYDWIKEIDKNKNYSFIANRYIRTSLKELINGEYIDLDKGLNEVIDLEQSGRKFEGEIEYPGGRAKVIMVIDSDNKFLGTGFYRYLRKNDNSMTDENPDIGTYQIIIGNNSGDKIYLKYKNRFSSNPSVSEKVEGIEIWTKVSN